MLARSPQQRLEDALDPVLDCFPNLQQSDVFLINRSILGRIKFVPVLYTSTNYLHQSQSLSKLSRQNWPESTLSLGYCEFTFSSMSWSPALHYPVIKNQVFRFLPYVSTHRGQAHVRRQDLEKNQKD